MVGFERWIEQSSKRISFGADLRLVRLSYLRSPIATADKTPPVYDPWRVYGYGGGASAIFGGNVTAIGAIVPSDDDSATDSV